MGGAAFAVRLRQPAYFECDYTTKTCMRGLTLGNMFVGEVLAEDRATVLAHIWCHGSTCINFDDGSMRGPSSNGTLTIPDYLKQDEPASEIERLRGFCG